MSEIQRILITGGTGFLGRYNHAELETSGHTVISSTSNEGKSIGNEKLVFLDPRDKRSYQDVVSGQRPDTIIHMSALSSPSESETNPESWLVNVGSVENAIAAIVKTKESDTNYDPVFVFYSSVEVHRDGEPGKKITEETKLDPSSKYSEMKIAAEKFIHKTCSDNKIKYIIVRQGQTIGVGQSDKFLIPKVVSQLADIVEGNNVKFGTDGVPYIETGYTGNKRTLLDARDSAKAIRALIESGRYGTYMICGDSNQTLEQVIKYLMTLAKDRSGFEINHVQKQGTATHQPDRDYDNSKIKNEVGWYPETTLHETLKWIMYSELAQREVKVS